MNKNQITCHHTITRNRQCLTCGTKYMSRATLNVIRASFERLSQERAETRPLLKLAVNNTSHKQEP